MEKQKKKFVVPHTYVILLAIALVMAIFSYIIPAGEYDRVLDEATGRNVVDPDSFHYVEGTPLKPFDLFKAVPQGMDESASIIFFIFIVGASFGIVMATGSIQRGISHITMKVRGKEAILIPVILFLFSLGGATFGMAEEIIAFIPITVLLARSLGYDCIIGVALGNLGGACGFVSGWMNPFTVGVAQGIAEVPLFSGIWLRLVLWICMLASATFYMVRYAKKVQKNPETSLVRDLEIEAQKAAAESEEELEDVALTGRDKLILLAIVVSLLTLVYGVFKYGWYFHEIAALFLIMGIVCGAIGGFGPSKMAEEFVKGAGGIVFGALIVGIARTISVVMTNAGIIDTVVYGLASIVGKLPKAIAGIVMFWVQSLINFFIPSGSGQATVTMPIMAPLGDVLGMTRQTSVLAFQMGDGFSNSIIPTGGSLMAALSIAKIPYEKWFKWILPLMSFWILIMGAIFMVVAVMIGYN